MQQSNLANKPKNRWRWKYPLRDIVGATIILSVIMLFAWDAINNQLHWPVDFGVMTGVCLVLLVFVIFAIIRAISDIKKMISRQLKFSIFNFVPLLFTLIAFLAVGYFEFRQQFVQIVMTPIVRQVSGVPTALARCDRLATNLFAPTRPGYVAPKVEANGEMTMGDVAHFNPSACNDIFNWYVWQAKTNTTYAQAWSLNTVMHEATHVGGQTNELITSCIGLDWIKDELIRLGATPAEAERVYQLDNQTQKNIKVDVGGTAPYVGDCDTEPAQYHRKK